MKLFTFCESHYNITIKNPLQFQLVVAYLASGLSFRQVESVFNKTKKLTANAQLGTISDTTVANYVCTSRMCTQGWQSVGISHYICAITSASNKSVTGIVLFTSNLSAFPLHFAESCPCHNYRVGIGGTTLIK